jgi:hypothetical protein
MEEGESYEVLLFEGSPLSVELDKLFLLK